MERELAQYQGRTGDPEIEKKLKRQIHKYKALLQVRMWGGGGGGVGHYTHPL